MKRILCLLLCLLLTGCTVVTPPATTSPAPSADTTPAPTDPALEVDVTITLADSGITTDAATDAVFPSNDIIYYEDRIAYESGNPYGDGGKADRHDAAEAAAHTVVNITAPGTYRVTGKLSAGQIRVDLGEDAFTDPNAVVNLILDGVDITCTVAPAILFLNVFECDNDWSVDTAKPDVDTTAAGANLILAAGSINQVNGSYVAKIYKDKEGEKKLWKQDGAIYSYMSMNVLGSGTLNLQAANEGLDSELHLTIGGGNINIYSDNDGINTNEDGVSVTTINAGNLHIIAGLGAEGDGIDSNGYLVINGGTVVSSANPAADAGLDSDLGSFVNGGTVVALGSTMDWAESDSLQVTMNLQFAQYQTSGCAIVVTDLDGKVVFAYDPSEDEVLGSHQRRYMGAVLSCGNFRQGQTYHVWLDGTLTGTETAGVYDVTTITAYDGGIQQAFTGTDVSMGPGGFGGMGQPPQMSQDGSRPEGGRMPGGERPQGDWMPDGQFPGGMGENSSAGDPQTEFYMQDKVNCFSGIANA